MEHTRLRHLSRSDMLSVYASTPSLQALDSGLMVLLPEPNPFIIIVGHLSGQAWLLKNTEIASQEYILL